MSSSYITAIAGFLIVLGLMGITLFLLKKLMERVNHSFSNSARINITETRYIDPKNKLVIVNVGKKEHLILVGITNNILIDSNLIDNRKDDNKDTENLLKTAVEKIKNDASN